MEKNITGYKWISLKEFENDRAVCDNHFGFPLDGCVTKTTMEANISYTIEGEIDFYYVGENIQLTDILGESIEFTIRIITG